MRVNAMRVVRVCARCLVLNPQRKSVRRSTHQSSSIFFWSGRTCLHVETLSVSSGVHVHVRSPPLLGSRGGFGGRGHPICCSTSSPGPMPLFCVCCASFFHNNAFGTRPLAQTNPHVHRPSVAARKKKGPGSPRVKRERDAANSAWGWHFTATTPSSFTEKCDDVPGFAESLPLSPRSGFCDPGRGLFGRVGLWRAKII